MAFCLNFVHCNLKQVFYIRVGCSANEPMIPIMIIIYLLGGGVMLMRGEIQISRPNQRNNAHTLKNLKLSIN